MPSRTKKKPLKKQPEKRTPDPRAYPLVIVWSAEDSCYLAKAPALEGCITHGRTPEDAFTRGQEAVALWLEEAVRNGDNIPKPAPTVSGKLTLRMPPSLHRDIAEAAEQEGVSINQWVVTRLARAS